MSDTRWVYSFGAGKAEGAAAMKELLGGKGANLAEMSNLGLPVPPGLTITTQVCTAYYQLGGAYPPELKAQVGAALAVVEAQVGRGFGDAGNPLLVSVRSGARASMPGMMDTVLNLGLNDETVEGLAAQAGDRRFAFDSYRRFIQMYANVVLGADHGVFEEILSSFKEINDYKLDTELTAQDWEDVVVQFKRAVHEHLGRPFPMDVHEQLWGAIGAVFTSWMNERAKVYRRLHDIPESWGTAVNVQAMVFGNMGETSATGVAFTRDPSTGEPVFYGEYLINAQGEDVVAGIRNPKSLTKAARERMKESGLSLEEAMPDAFAQLVAVYKKLERHYRDMQDIEFTIERGVLWMLQTRNGKRTAKAALRIAVDLANDGLISQEEAVMRVDPAALEQLLHPAIAPDYPRDVLCTGLPASPGAAFGKVVFSSASAVEMAKRGEAVILVRDETSPEDIQGMHAAKAIVTARGGMTSHAAVVARGMGRPCVCGASEIRFDPGHASISIRGRVVKEGEIVTVDGAKGQVLAGAADMAQPELSGDFEVLMGWADSHRRLKVRVNGETPDDARVARGYGAEGVGLCRTEHMFFAKDRIQSMREMILAEETEGRVRALDKLLPFQRTDFLEIFRVMQEFPVTIRLLDPPLHEFLPQDAAQAQAVASESGLEAAGLLARAKSLHEHNPMLGFRGCRLAIEFPEIYDMQVRAIFEAALAFWRESGKRPQPEVMVPFVMGGQELALIKARIQSVAQGVLGDAGAHIPFLIGTMIELPRAALLADEIAREAQFFSFGTNDLTQTTLGISRDDAGRFLGAYVEKGILERDPFVSLDLPGVGALIRLAAERGRQVRPEVKLGICGEHGGDPASIRFCEEMRLDYVSCSPFRVPIARLAAAQAALLANKR